MKIAVTGAGHSLGKNICEVLSESHTIVQLTGKVETYQDTILDEVKDCDVFINCGYKDRIQSALFRKVYLDWKYKEKTIVNILTSALMFGSPNKKYVDDIQPKIENKIKRKINFMISSTGTTQPGLIIFEK